MQMYPWAYPANTSPQIARQTEVTYENYDRIRAFNDVGFFLQNYVNEGGVVTKHVTFNNVVVVTAISASLDNHVLARDGANFTTKIPSVTYYLDFDGDWKWGTAHPDGVAGTDYLTVAEVTTDSNGNVDVITDTANPRGGFRLKDTLDFRSPYYDAQLEDKEKEISTISNYYYEPVGAIEAIDGSGSINVNTIKAADVYTLYDALQPKYKGAFTKTLLGNDSSGTLPMYRYAFRPHSWTHKIILGTSIHGDGGGGDPKDDALALYLFMKDLIENGQKNPKLAELLCNTYFIIMPVENPWGFNNNSRKNSNMVDINRNFDWKWNEYPTYSTTHPNYKGTAAFSEKESQYIRDTLLLHPDAVAYIDFHVWADMTTFRYVYANSSTSVLNGMAYKLSEYLSVKYGTTFFSDIAAYDNVPNAFNYAEKVLFMPSANPEYVANTTNMTPRTSSAMTRMVEWYGNWVWLNVKERKKKNIPNYNARRLSILQANAVETIPNSNYVLKAFSNMSVLNPFQFDSNTGEIIIPFGVGYVTISAQVFFYFDNTAAETMQIALFIQKNGARFSGYPVSKNTVSLGGAASDLRELCVNISSPLIPVAEGDKFRLVAYTTHTGGKLKTSTAAGFSQYEATWFAIEEIDRFRTTV